MASRVRTFGIDGRREVFDRFQLRVAKDIFQKPPVFLNGRFERLAVKTNSIPPRIFGKIERLIRRSDEFFALICIRREEADADAHRQVGAMPAGDLKRGVAHRLLNPFRHGFCPFCIRFRQYNGEFLPAIAGSDVDRADTLSRDLYNFF